jgi:hypothetical protein
MPDASRVDEAAGEGEVPFKHFVPETAKEGAFPT